MKVRYPRLTILALSFVAVYIMFAGRMFPDTQQAIHGIGYLGIFITGMTFSYGFTTPFALAVFFTLGGTYNPYEVALIGGIGAMVSDLFIFRFIRTGFDIEIHRLARERWVRMFGRMIPKKIRHYVLPVIGGVVLASPLPDEIGVSLIASSHVVSGPSFALFAYTMNTLGILVFVLLGKTAGA